MANRHDLEINISDSGEVEITVKGVAGTSCTEITKDLEDMLGIVTDRGKTSEYYKTPVEGTVHIGLNEDEK